MCGISGIVSKERIEPHTIRDISNALRHRGPDAKNIYISDSGRIALGHNRLSVIDLSQQANQPMYSKDGRFVIIFNGEIYNFKTIRKELEINNPGIHFI